MRNSVFILLFTLFCNNVFSQTDLMRPSIRPMSSLRKKTDSSIRLMEKRKKTTVQVTKKESSKRVTVEQQIEQMINEAESYRDINDTKMVELYQKAASMGSSYATFMFTKCVLYGIGIRQDFDQAGILFKKMADIEPKDEIEKYVKAYSAAMTAGDLFEMKEYAECYKYALYAAIEDEDAECQGYLALMYLFGLDNIPVDHDKARVWAEKSLKSEYPSEYAAYAYAMLTLHGQGGLDRDVNLAERWLIYAVDLEKKNLEEDYEDLKIVTNWVKEDLQSDKFSKRKIAINNNVNFTMIRIPAGKAYKYKKVRECQYLEEVTGRNGLAIPKVKEFYMAETEVTNKLWCAVMNESLNGLNPNEPKMGISYKEAQEFIDRLKQITGYRFRFPYMMEWIRVATNEKFRSFSGHSKIEDCGWYKGNSAKIGKVYQPHEVGKLLPGAFGIYDLTGNVGEYCIDGGVHTMGGSCGSSKSECEAYSEKVIPVEYMGLRLACSSFY